MTGRRCTVLTVSEKCSGSTTSCPSRSCSSLKLERAKPDEVRLSSSTIHDDSQNRTSISLIILSATMSNALSYRHTQSCLPRFSVSVESSVSLRPQFPPSKRKIKPFSGPCWISTKYHVFSQLRLTASIIWEIRLYPCARVLVHDLNLIPIHGSKFEYKNARLFTTPEQCPLRAAQESPLCGYPSISEKCPAFSRYSETVETTSEIMSCSCAWGFVLNPYLISTYNDIVSYRNARLS